MNTQVKIDLLQTPVSLLHKRQVTNTCFPIAQDLEASERVTEPFGLLLMLCYQDLFNLASSNSTLKMTQETAFYVTKLCHFQTSLRSNVLGLKQTLRSAVSGRSMGNDVSASKFKMRVSGLVDVAVCIPNVQTKTRILVLDNMTQF